MKRILFGCAALAAALTIAAGAALAAPVITNITPSKTAANTGDTVDITGTGFGSLTDIVRFPGTVDVNPTALIAGGVRVRVPNTWSGDVQVYSGGAWSNAFAHEISYNYTGTKWTTLPFTWTLNNNGAPGCTFDETRSALILAYGPWTCGSGLSTTWGGGSATAVTSYDGENCRYWSNTGWSPGTIATTTRWYTGSQILESDIAFNAQHFTWSVTGAPGTMDIQDIATHEEGHTIGLRDVYGDADSLETMYGFTGPNEYAARSLASDDAEGAEFMYPHTRANLCAAAPGGWYSSITPRNTNDATDTYAPLPATLNGNTTTYMNGTDGNNGGDCASPGAHDTWYLDDVLLWNPYWWGAIADGNHVSWMNYPMTVRGGRHTLKQTIDDQQEILESNESDNSAANQYVWSPFLLPDHVPVFRYNPPARGGWMYPNCDGFQFDLAISPWGCAGMVPINAADDFDMRSHSTTPTSTAGFDAYVAGSGYGAGQSDFVLVNGNNAGMTATRTVGVDRWSGTNGGFYISYSQCLGSTVAPGLSPVRTLDWGQIVNVEEFYFTTGSWDVVLDNQTGTGNLGVALYSCTGMDFGKSNALAIANANGNGQDEMFTYTIATTGWYGIVVFKNGSDDLLATNTYQLDVHAPAPNFKPDNVPGWDYPLVPRNDNTAADGNVHVSAVLDGNATTTYQSATGINAGTAPGLQNDTRLYIDGANSGLVFNFFNLDPGERYSFLNAGPLNVRGGRHTLEWRSDYDFMTAELDESDNNIAHQFVWSPLALTKDTPFLRQAPPDRGTGTYPNSDGFQFTGTTGFAWATALCPVNSEDDYDLNVYNDYSGAESGFSAIFASSAATGGHTDVVGGRYDSAGSPRYPAAILWAGGAGNYWIDANDAAPDHDSAVPATWNNQTILNGHLIDVFEVYLEAGRTYTVQLTNVSGSADLVLSLHPPSAATLVPYTTHEIMFNSNGAGGNEGGDFAPLETGWHPFLVYKSGSRDIPLDSFYNLSVTVSTVGVEQAALPKAYALLQNTPNPFNPVTAIPYEVPAPGSAVRLEIYDLTGHRVRTLVDEAKGAGRFEAVWDGRNDAGEALGSGVYFYRFRAGSFEKTEKMMLLK